MSDRLTASCLDTLAAWTPPDAEQAQLRLDFERHLRFVGSQGGATTAPGWSRDRPGGHLTASAAICTGDAVLLTLHAKLGRWLQTGGHLEQDDVSLPEAALREAREESGLLDLRLDPVPVLLSRHVVPCGPVRPCQHLDVQFVVRSSVAAPPVFGVESHDVVWFPFEALPEVDDSVRALVAAARTRLGA